MEKEVLPWFPMSIEKFFLNSSTPYVVDYDDAVYHRYDQHRNPLIRLVLSRKIRRIMAFSSLVVAGNKYIYDYVLRSGTTRVEILPTVVNIQNYSIKQDINHFPFRVGWIGSPSTSRHINIASEALNKFCKIKYAEFVAIGALEQDLTKIPGQLIPWNEQTQNRELTLFDVGIMPLPDTPWERGKCGFKLIQYMACGLPVIASPVGVNRNIVEHGVNGFLAGNEKEWIEYLEILKDDTALRSVMGASGREKIEKKYSLEVVAPKLVSILKKAAEV
jgi:glycosyltransferase involved in cell wall biosynthesis